MTMRGRREGARKRKHSERERKATRGGYVVTSLEIAGSVHMPSLPRTGIQLPFVEDLAWLRFSNDMYSIVRTGYLASARGWSRTRDRTGETARREVVSYHAPKSTVSPDTGVDSVKMISLVSLVELST